MSMDAARSQVGLSWRGALQVCVALIGITMFICGAALSVLWGQPRQSQSFASEPEAGAAAQVLETPIAEPPVPITAIQRATGRVDQSVVVFDEPRLVLQFQVRTADYDRPQVLERFLSEVQGRIDQLGDLEITFAAPNRRDQVASLQFSDHVGGRWVVHLVDLADAAGDMKLCARVAEFVSDKDRSEAKSEQLDQTWQEVQRSIALPILDAADEAHDEIMMVHPKPQG